MTSQIDEGRIAAIPEEHQGEKPECLTVREQFSNQSPQPNGFVAQVGRSATGQTTQRSLR
jgi:hypothetical protein